MEKILVTGATGQIGSELVPALRKLCGNGNIIAAGHSKEPAGELENGPCTTLDVTDFGAVISIIKKYDIRKIFHLSSILSSLGEKNPSLVYSVNFNGLYNILEAAREFKIKRVIVPSSIAAFGKGTPQENTPNDTIQKPSTMYGISKVFGELIGNYYYKKFGLDVRGVRFPGIISWKTEPTSGTTDYAVAIYYEAVRKKQYTCYLKENARLPMMYMPDAVSALIDLDKADGKKLIHRADFNVNSMSFAPKEIAETIKKRIPDFKIDYKIDPIRQTIAESWPYSLDDSTARKEWGWTQKWDMDKMTDDMLKNLRIKLGKS